MKKTLLTLCIAIASYCSFAQTISATSPLSYNSSTGVISSQPASATQDGHLLSTDWNIFNNKQPAITFGTGVQTALGVNIGSTGAPVLFNNAGGTPSSLTLTNATGLPNTGLVNSTISGISLGGNLANLTGNSTLTFSGTYNGSTARTVGLNLGNTNTWTGTQTFNGINVNSIIPTVAGTSAMGSTVQPFGEIISNTFSNYSSVNRSMIINFNSYLRVFGFTAGGGDFSNNTIAFLAQPATDILIGTAASSPSGTTYGIKIGGFFNPNNRNYYALEFTPDIYAGHPNMKLGEDVDITIGGVSSNYVKLVHTMTPSVDNTINLGSSSFRWANVYATTFTGNLVGNASTVSTNANLTGPITSVGNATSIASQTGTGNKFVMDTSPTLITPTLGLANATSLGIGTVSPAAKLDVTGTAMFGGSSVANLDPGAGSISYVENTGKTLIGWNRSASEGETDFIGNRGLGTSGGFSFYNHDNSGTETQLIRIKGDGSVGIGTPYPDAKLAVNGTIHTKEVKVDLSSWPDYVFKPKYDLPSLAQVKTYIDQNQHLPDMPSEAEVAKNGINLGEIVKVQTKKIEELTLYAIDQQKQIELLKQQQDKSKQQDAHIKALEAALSKLTTSK